MRPVIHTIFCTILISTLSASAWAGPKTCTATLGGTLKKKTIEIPDPHVFYPDATGISKPAKWIGSLKSVAFVAPMPVEIECGKAFLYANFSSFTATGLMPEAIQTSTWEKIGYDGKPKTVLPEILYGFGDSYDYPYPAVNMDSETDLIVNEPAPAGVSDVCKLKKLPLSSLSANVFIRPDPFQVKYKAFSTDGEYYFDVSKSPSGVMTELELDEPFVNISCGGNYTYEATFEWPYEFNVDDGMGGQCKGNVHRKMEIKGEFILNDENKLIGFLEVSKPTVTHSGSVTGSYDGKSFTMMMEGLLYDDASGKSKADLLPFDGGDGITWNYTLSCYGSEIKNSLFGAVREYFKVMNNAETPSVSNPGYLSYDSDLDNKTLTVDMGGQGIVTIHRVWKKK